MKIRSDFVSNSSSCSFVIHDLKAFNEKLKVLSSAKDGNGIDTFWMYDLDIRFNFKNTKDNKKVFKEFTDRYTYNNDEWIYGSGDFQKFLQIDPQYYGQLDNVEVYAYDDCGNEGIQKLADLAGDDLVNVVNHVKAVKKADGRYQTFSGKADDASGKVKFIIETDQIGGEDE